MFSSRKSCTFSFNEGIRSSGKVSPRPRALPCGRRSRIPGVRAYSTFNRLDAGRRYGVCCRYLRPVRRRHVQCILAAADAQSLYRQALPSAGTLGTHEINMHLELQSGQHKEDSQAIQTHLLPADRPERFSCSVRNAGRLSRAMTL
jgi:hypothetical protein